MSKYERLTGRQSQVLSLYVDGHTNKDIATMLGISTRTVDAHLHAVRRRLGLYSRSDLVRYFRGLTK